MTQEAQNEAQIGSQLHPLTLATRQLTHSRPRIPETPDGFELGIFRTSFGRKVTSFSNTDIKHENYANDQNSR